MCKCNDCGDEIPQARLDFLPDTEYCINCSDKHTFKYVARMIYPHKTGGDLFVAKSKGDAERLNREYTRAR
jgi:hypothetical protein